MRLPTDEEIRDVGMRLGVVFHPDFHQYLLQASDVCFGIFEPVTITIPEAHTELNSVCKSAWEDWDVPKNLLPICEDNADFYCINDRGEIVFWSHNGTSDEKWPNLAAWIEQVWIGESSE